MNEAILEILADAFECSEREAEAATKCDAYDYERGRADAYRDVVTRLRRIVEGGTGVRAGDA